MDRFSRSAPAPLNSLLPDSVFHVHFSSLHGHASQRRISALIFSARQGPVDESFSRAAFELKAGEISPPVRSPFGVHLIRCDEVVPGTKKLADLTGPIDEALAKELLEKISQREREKTEVKYTSAWPHFKPGTRELEK